MTIHAAALGAAALGAAATLVANGTLRAAPPGGHERWTRTNHAGRSVTLLEGPAYAVGSTSGAVLAAVFAGGRHTESGSAAVVAGLGAAGFGAVDDLVGDSISKGLGGHLTALMQGRLTTGAVKILGLGMTGAAAAFLADRHRDQSPAAARQQGSRVGPRLLSGLVGGAVIAGSANLANLLDLRPGRALKVCLLLGTPLAARGSVTAAAAVGAAAAVLPADLAGRSMLGDTGANSLGALLGTALVQQSGLRGRLAALGVLTALTLASEKVSFTAVIESTPGLRELDALGRRPRG